VTRAALLAATLALFMPYPVSAETLPEPRVVAGTVLDPSGAAVPGATVRLLESAGERESVTDGAGRFEFEGVIGRARLEVGVQGFAPAGLDVTSDTRELTVRLTPARVREAMVVDGSLPFVIHTGTKTKTPLRDVPQAVTVLTRETIEDHRMRGMADVVRYVPGVGMGQGEGNRDNPIFRGNSSTSDFFVDGVRDDTQYVRDLYNVERVEAFKGANAMIFGRGGVGGVINRVLRHADWTDTRELTLQAGSWNERRLSADLARPFGPRFATRATALYENSDTYRDGVGVERWGFNPTVAVSLGSHTVLRAGYEVFHDERTADRGVPSHQGRPLQTDTETFFGRADLSDVEATVHSFSSTLEHQFDSRLTLRAHVRHADYDKFYQNVYPGAVNAAGDRVSLSAYNNDTRRQNLFQQTDLVFTAETGRLRHTLLAGFEVGWQVTDNLRQTGYFGGTATSVSVPVAMPTTTAEVAFRPSATDAHNHGVAKLAALYVQDQIALGSHVQAIVGLRYDRFQVDFQNLRTGAELESRDGLVSPRLGLVVKPTEPLSIYASTSRSYLPRAGEQLSSLSPTNASLEPESFRNHELGAKWDVRPALSLTAAAYRLRRGNVFVPDPLDPAVSRLVDAQESEGLEIGLDGRLTPSWTVIGAYAWQDARITQSIAANAAQGARLAQVPRHSFSLWTKYAVTPSLAAGVGLMRRGDVFTSTDNTVVLPAYLRVDAAVFFKLSAHLRGQVNLENVLGEEYFAFSNGNNNITPGAPRGVRAALTTTF
jgi:catecholate siderophore receptor